MRHIDAATVPSAKRQRLNVAEPETNSSVDKSVDKTTDSMTSLFDPTDRDMDHHSERNLRELPRLGKTSNKIDKGALGTYDFYPPCK